MEEFGKKKKKKGKRRVNKTITINDLLLDDNVDIDIYKKNDSDTYSYYFLLNRAIENIPQKYKNEDKKKIVFKDPIVFSKSKTTTRFVNFENVCLHMIRPFDHVIKFLKKSLDCPKISMHSSKELIINKHVTYEQIKKALLIYMKNYIKCYSCQKFETRLIKEKNRLLYVHCSLCLARRCCNNLDDYFL